MQHHRDGCCGKTLILGICFLLGLTFFFCGISQSTNREGLDRKRMIQRYNKMVKDWNSKHREDYAKIEHAYVSIENYTLSMLQSNTNVEFMTDPQEDIEQSDSFKLSASIAPGAFHHKIEPYEKFSLQVKVVDSQRKSILYLPALSFVRSRIIQSRTHKECYNAHRGTVFSHDNSCRIHELLSSVCIKISRVKPKIAKDRIWKTDERYGGIGCVPGVDGDWPISQYRILPATSAKDWIPPKSVRLLPFTIQVRSTKDPFIGLARISDGSMQFGPTQEDHLRAGIFLMMLGLFFMIPVIMMKDPSFLYWLQSRGAD